MARKRQKTAQSRSTHSRSRFDSDSDSDTSVNAFLKKVYFLNGISYEALDDASKASKEDPIHDLKLGPLPPLAGKMELDLVFYSSTICRSVNMMGPGHFESIHRTLRGSLVLDKIMYQDTPNVICGGIQIQDDGTGKLQSLGDTLEFSFLEAKEAKLKKFYRRITSGEEDDDEEEEEPECETNIFAFKTDYDDRNWMDPSNFHMCRTIVNEEGKEEEEEVPMPELGMFGKIGMFLNMVRPNTGIGKIQVLQERFPLRQCPDELRDCSFRPAGERLSPISKETRMQQAQQQMEQFQNCNSDYWICKHLGLPALAAAMVRSYLKPAPILYLEKGDYVIRLEDQKYDGSFDYLKVFVFRPKNTM